MKHFVFVFRVQILPSNVVLASRFSTKAKENEPVKKSSALKAKEKDVPSSSQKGGKSFEAPHSQAMAEGSGSLHGPLATPNGQVRVTFDFSSSAR